MYFEQVSVHYKEICTSGLQQFTVHLKIIIHIVSATELLIRCTVKYFKHLVQNS